MTEYPIVNAVLFAALGIAVFAIAFTVFVKAWPVDLWKEIAQEKNIAVAILAGAVALGLCWIIAAAMH